MSVAAPPEPPRTDELELLIREARARQRKRWVGAAAFVVGAALGLNAVLSGGGSRTEQGFGPGPHMASAVSHCRADQLEISVAGGGVAGGTVGIRFEFTNRSQNPCMLSGWPSIKLVLPEGRQVTPRPHNAISERGYSVRHPPPLPRNVLRPGAGVLWDVNALDGTGLNRACPEARRALVIVPGTHAALFVNATLPYCGPRSFWVFPIGRT